MSVNNALSDDEWGAWGKNESTTIAKTEESNYSHNSGFGSDDNSNKNDHTAPKSKFTSQGNFGSRFQEKSGGYNDNKASYGDRYNAKRDDNNSYNKRNGNNRDYSNRNQNDDYQRNGNNSGKENFKRNESPDKRYRSGRTQNEHRRESPPKDNRSNFQRNDYNDSRENRNKTNGYNRDDSAEDRRNYRNTQNKRNEGRMRDNSDDSRGNYRNKRRDDSRENIKNYRANKKEDFDRDDSRENRPNFRNKDRRDDSRDRRRDDSRDRRRGADESREKRSNHRDDDRDGDYRRNRKRDDSSDSDYKAGKRGGNTNRDDNRDMDEIHDKFDRKTRLDGQEAFSSRTFTRGQTASAQDNQTDDNAAPKRVTFIPNDDQADYELHVNSGINFDNYEKIPVEVTGDNAPTAISTFAELSLPEFLINNIADMKYSKLTPVQKYAIPIISANRDLMACAQTGSGKTAAFLIPIIKSLHELPAEAGETSQVAFPKALIMAPTRELCRQIFTAARQLCRGSNVKCAYIYGGIEMNKSRRNIQSSGCDILVATPGRLVHFLELVWISLRHMRFFVLDEADRMLDAEGFYESVNKIYTDANCVGDTARSIQISMFSATFPGEIQSLARNLLKNYLFLAVGSVGSANSDVRQEVLAADQRDKINTAIEFIKTIPDEKTLIFVESKRMADFFGVKLGYLGFKATTIHGDREQEQREIALNDFKSGRVNLMVATNVAARGLDIPMVDNVINIDMPSDIDTYVHRIGRTGRCGNVGRAISFFDEAKDIGLATALVAKLEEANQEVADWLRLLSDGGGARAVGGGYGHSRDTRRGVAVSKFVDNPAGGDGGGQFMRGTNVDYEESAPASSEWLED